MQCLSAVEMSTNRSWWNCRLDSERRASFDRHSLEHCSLEIETDANNPQWHRACCPSQSVRRLDRRIVDAFVSSSSVMTHRCRRSNQPCLRLVEAWTSMLLAVSVDCHSAKGSCSLGLYRKANEAATYTWQRAALKNESASIGDEEEEEEGSYWRLECSCSCEQCCER
jgi:hypothetical protein